MTEGGSPARPDTVMRPWRQLVAYRPSWVDLGLAVSTAVYAIALFSVDDARRGLAAYALLGLVCFVIVVRRLSPELALVVVGTVRWWQHVDERVEAYVTVALFVCVFTVAALRSLPRALVSAGGCTLLVLLTAAGVNWHAPAVVASTVGYLGTAMACGLSVKHQRAVGETLREQVAGLERTASAREALAVDEERSRLRDDLHDIVGHHLNLALILTQKAQLAMSRDDPDSCQALHAIETATRSALEEMDRATKWIGTKTERAPTPTLASYESLLQPLTEAGINVTVSTPPRDDLAQINLVASATAHRALQEALTNVMKHSAEKWAKVEITLEPRLLQIVVTSGRARHHTNASRQGTGLEGMRRRVELLGGSLETTRNGYSHLQRITVPWSRRTTK